MNDLKDRTKDFAFAVFRSCDKSPQRQVYWIIGKQFMRSAASIGANYRSA